MRTLYFRFQFVCFTLFLGFQVLPCPAFQDSLPGPRPEVKTLLDAGRNAFLASRIEEALKTFQKALDKSLDTKDRAGQGIALLNIGSAHLQLGHTEVALGFYGQALPILEEVSDRPSQAKALRNSAIAYNNLAKPQIAIECLQKAQQLYQALQDEAGEAATMGNLGAIYFYTGRNQEALNLFLLTLPKARRGHDLIVEGDTLTGIASVYVNLGKMAEAITYFNQALQVQQAIPDPMGEARTLTGLGVIYSGLGKPLEALAFHQRALVFNRTLHSEDGEATTLLNIGNVYGDLGEQQQALACYTQALVIFQKRQNARQEASTLMNIGSAYFALSRLNEALNSYEQSLRIIRAMGDASGGGKLLTGIGNIYYQLGNPDKALEFHQKALPLLDKTQNLAGVAMVRSNLGNAYALRGNFDEALKQDRMALDLFRSLKDTMNEAGVLSNIAALESVHGNVVNAEHDFQSALAILERTRYDLGDLREARVSFMETRLATYHAYIGLLLRQSRTEQAYLWAQKAKARTLIDQMGPGRAVIAQTMNADEKTAENALNARLVQLNKQWVEASADRAMQAKVAEQLQQAEIARQRFVDALCTHHPELGVKRALTTATVTDIAPLLTETSAILEYVCLKAGEGRTLVDQTVLLCLTREKGKILLRSYVIKKSRAELEKLATEYRDLCASRNGSGYQRKGWDLYSLLFAPAARQLAGKSRLTICPDGPLWNLPFHALWTSPSEAAGVKGFLMARYPISYAYSATAARASRDEWNSAKRLQPVYNLLALANPDFGSDTRFSKEQGVLTSRAVSDQGSSNPATRRSLLEALPNTRKEAQELMKFFPQATLRTGREAQEAFVKKEAGKYRYLHFATHGLFNAAVPMMSSVVLAQPATNSEEDGFLTAREILGMRLAADMVVLSACETARGEIHSGEGLVGLVWALFVAGAPTQVVSQWKVNDAGTRQLMTVFYRELNGGKPKDVAMQSAMLSVANAYGGKTFSPYYWAAFQVFGDVQPLRALR